MTRARMNTNIKDWISALRSGKYKQGHGHLRYEDKYCCLGVACELATAAGIVGPATAEDGGLFHYGPERHTGHLPDEVQAWLGLASPTGSYRGHWDELSNSWVAESLARLNDTGFSFEAIAK